MVNIVFILQRIRYLSLEQVGLASIPISDDSVLRYLNVLTQLWQRFVTFSYLKI